MPTKLPRRTVLHLTTSAAALTAMSGVSGLVRADTYPSRPVRLIVGLAAGGPTDVAARVVAEWLSQYFGQQFVVENRTGVAGNLATEAAANSPADGYTLLFGGPSITISMTLYKDLPFNRLENFTPVASVAHFPNLMVVPAAFPAKTVAEFIDYAKANPGQVSYASSGVGASPHLSAELFKFMTNTNLVHVPYRGSSAVYPDLLSGRVQMFFDNLGGPVAEMVRAGKLRALGVTTIQRWPSLPEVPAIAETVPGYEVNVWYGIIAPRNTPGDVAEKLNGALNASLADPEKIGRFTKDGVMPMPMTTAEFGKFLADDTDKWRKVIEFAGIKPD
jgi:tripartite-type tricarboxylate transporter receptor subunit TctC